MFRVEMSLSDFLIKHRLPSQKGVPRSERVRGNYMDFDNSYRIDDRHQLVSLMKDEGIVFNLCEVVHGDSIRFFLDVDCKSDHPDRVVTFDWLLLFVTKVMNLLNTDKCVVLQRPMPYLSKGKWRDGAHIYFPECVVSDVLATHQMLKEKTKEITDVIPDVSIFNECYRRAHNLMMYGSTKEGALPYEMVWASYKVEDPYIELTIHP